MKKNKKKAFTLVELLAVIVILAVILIIAVPQIMKTIKETKLKTMEDSAKLIATNADKDYLAQQAVNANYNATSIPCTDVAKLNDDYASCSITYDSNGVATVKLKGASGSKFAGITCTGTKDNMNCSELVGYTDAVELLTSKIGTGGLIKDDHDELRYQGSNPDNYVTFNDEVWRIVGLFNVDGEQRVKLVRKDSIGSFSWDSSLQSGTGSVNFGFGVNQWGPSGTYEGADLMRELNGDYLNSSLSENPLWYNGVNSYHQGTFDKMYALTNDSQELIGDATWYTGGLQNNSTVTLAEAYAAERGTTGKLCTSGSSCTDEVERTYTWTGKVGMIYPSDFGYASGNASCKANLCAAVNCSSNWLFSSGWTITPESTSSRADFVWITSGTNAISATNACNTNNVRPSVYLVPDVQMKGSGTTADPYVFAK